MHHCFPTELPGPEARVPSHVVCILRAAIVIVFPSIATSLYNIDLYKLANGNWDLPVRRRCGRDAMRT